MPDVDTWLVQPKDMPKRVGTGPTFFRRQFTSGTAVQNADVVRICQIPRNHIVFGATVTVSGTLGASATAQLRRQTTALTAATTAGSASRVQQNAVDEPNTTAGTDYLNLLAGGANWGTSATITVEGFFEPVIPGLES